MMCTWKGCNAKATKSQLDRNGNEWANLCQAHHDELEKAIEVGTPKSILRA